MNDKNTWHVDSPIKMQQSSAITSMVIYKDVNEDKNWDAQYYDADAQKTGVLNLCVGRTSLQVFDGNDTIAFIITPAKVQYEKEIYNPGKAELQMHVTDGDRTLYASRLRKMFIGRNITVDIVTWESALNKHISIARRYYIQNLRLTHRNGSDTVATIVCYSPDYKMTLDRTCQVYSGKKFADDIFKSGVRRYKVGAVSCPVNDLLFLSYEKEKKSVGSACSDNGARDELLQPYLMQYNESFYNFMCRTAFRCGEFLYYENGILHLGLPEKTRKAMVEKPTGLPVLTPYSVTYPDLGMDTDSIDSMTESTPKAKPDRDNGLAGRTDRDLSKFTEADVPKVNLVKNGHQLIASLSMYASSKSAGEALILNALATTYSTLSSLVNLGFLGGIRKNILSVYKDFLAKPLPQNKEEKPVSTMLNSIYDNLCEQFYRQIAICEKKVTDSRITMDFDDTMPDVMLADAVTLNDEISEAYIITSMKGEFSLDVQHHTVEALPRLEKGKNLLLDRGIGDCHACWFPPMGAKTTEYPSTISSMEAIVTDNVDPFRLGRVRVKYTWQEGSVSQEPTGWLDIITPFAGQEGHTGGMFMMPEIGAHVMVNFVEEHARDGELPRSLSKYPYVVGSLFTNAKPAPGFEWEYSGSEFLPSNQVRTIQSSSGHGITFVDAPDSNFIKENIIPPIGQMINVASTVVGSDVLKGFGNACGGAMILHDASGFYSIEMNSSKRIVDIKSPLGNVSLSAFTGITISAPNGDINIEGKNVKITAGNNLTLQSGDNTSNKYYNLARNIGKDVTSWLTKDILLPVVTQVTQKYAGLKADKLTDLSFLQSAWEVLMRPVEGTLAINSRRNVSIIAGNGKTIIPAHLMSNAKNFIQSSGDKSKLTDTEYTPQINYGNLFILQTINLLDTIDHAVRGQADFLVRKACEVYRDIESVHRYAFFSDIINAIKTEGNAAKDIKDTIFSGDKVKEIKDLYKLLTDGNAKELKYTPAPLPANVTNPHKESALLQKIVELYNQALTAAQSLTKITKAVFVDSVNKDIKLNALGKGITFSAGDLFPSAGVPDNLYTLLGDGTVKNPSLSADFFNKINKQVFASAIKKLSKYYSTKEELKDDQSNWYDFIKGVGLVEKKAGTAVTGIKEGLLTTVGVKTFKTLVNWNGVAGPRATVDVTTGGSILLSDSPDYTYLMKHDGTGFELKKNSQLSALKRYLTIATGMAPKPEERPADPASIWMNTK